MEQYPSIQGSSHAPVGAPCIAFYKYDGSNLRWEWSPKRGWNKYGTRRQMFDESDERFGPAIKIFHETIADEIVYRTKQLVKNPERITAFTEFFGPNSFAGSHEPDDPKELRLFDVFLFKKGMLSAKQFVETFGDMKQAAEVVYQGNLTKQFIIDVKTSAIPNLVEGVIAKGSNERGNWSVKIKTHAYFEKLRAKYDGDWEKYAE